MSVFTVENISIGPQYGYGYGQSGWFNVQAELKCRIQFTCACGYDTMSFILTTYGTADNDVEALRKAVQHFFNYEFHDREHCIACRPNSCDCEDSPNIHEKMYYNFSNLDEPFRSLFEDLFKDSTWSIQKNIGNRPPAIPNRFA